MSGKGSLILEYDNFDRRAADFYLQMNKSQALQQAFLDNPAGILRRMIFPDAPFPSGGMINKANRLLYALLSNQNFLTWSRQFQASMESEIRQVGQADDRSEAIKGFLARFDRNKLYSEIVDGILASMDKETLYSLVVGTNLNDSISPGRAISSPDWLYSNEYVASELYAVVFMCTVMFLFVTQFDITPVIAPEGLSRADLQRISVSLTSALQEKAVKVRNSGALTSMDAVDKGGAL